MRSAAPSRSPAMWFASVAVVVGLVAVVGWSALSAQEADTFFPGSFLDATPDRPVLHDALSMPAEPTLSVESFRSASGQASGKNQT